MKNDKDYQSIQGKVYHFLKPKLRLKYTEVVAMKNITGLKNN